MTTNEKRHVNKIIINYHISRQDSREPKVSNFDDGDCSTVRNLTATLMFDDQVLSSNSLITTLYGPHTEANMDYIIDQIRKLLIPLGFKKLSPAEAIEAEDFAEAIFVLSSDNLEKIQNIIHRDHGLYI